MGVGEGEEEEEGEQRGKAVYLLSCLQDGVSPSCPDPLLGRTASRRRDFALVVPPDAADWWSGSLLAPLRVGRGWGGRSEVTWFWSAALDGR